MTTTDLPLLSHFLGLDHDGACQLFLPTFEGAGNLLVQSGDQPAPQLTYPGRTVADRDARAASYVAAVVGQAGSGGEIEWRRADDFVPAAAGTVFLFGSRTNRGADWITRSNYLGAFFHFEYGDRWSIQAAGARVFSITAPDGLSREDYAAQADYGVIGRVRKPGSSSHVFLLAGLGGRATEGCALYLLRNWPALASWFGDSRFALILRFPPPIDPMNSVPVVAFDDQHPEGFKPAH